MNAKYLTKEKDKRGSMTNDPITATKESTKVRSSTRKTKLPIKVETVLFLIHLAHGHINFKNWKALQDFVRRMRQRYVSVKSLLLSFCSLSFVVIFISKSNNSSEYIRERDNKGNPAVTFSQVRE